MCKMFRVAPLSHSVAGVSAGGSWATLAPPTAIAPIASCQLRFLSWDASTPPRAVLVVAVFTSPFTGGQVSPWLADVHTSPLCDSHPESFSKVVSTGR